MNIIWDVPYDATEENNFEVLNIIWDVPYDATEENNFEVLNIIWDVPYDATEENNFEVLNIIWDVPYDATEENNFEVFSQRNVIWDAHLILELWVPRHMIVKKNWVFASQVFKWFQPFKRIKKWSCQIVAIQNIGFEYIANIVLIF